MGAGTTLRGIGVGDAEEEVMLASVADEGEREATGVIGGAVVLSESKFWAVTGQFSECWSAAAEFSVAAGF